MGIPIAGLRTGEMSGLNKDSVGFTSVGVTENLCLLSNVTLLTAPEALLIIRLGFMSVITPGV